MVSRFIVLLRDSEVGGLPIYVASIIFGANKMQIKFNLWQAEQLYSLTTFFAQGWFKTIRNLRVG